MAWAQFVQQGMGMAGGLFDTSASIADARATKSQGYLTADANEERVRASSAQQLGEQRAVAAQSGFDPNSGSAAMLQAQSAGNAELAALTQRYAGQINAWRQDQIVNRTKSKFNFVMDPMGSLVGQKWGNTGKFLFGGPAGYATNRGLMSTTNSMGH